MERRKSIHAWMPLLCVMFTLVVLLFPAKASAATGLNVDTHTQAEIKAYFERIESSSSFAVTYEEEPVTTGPNYSAGKLSQSTLQGAVDMLNFMRYIAGIPYDVCLNDSYNQMAQAGALVNAVNNQMSHSPVKPQDMDADLYQLGYKGCSSSNLYSGVRDFRYGIEGWVSDEYNASGSNPGHRRWCLNPTMTATGFGKAGSYSAMYAFDNHWAQTSYTGVAWPAQQMPTQFFNIGTQWSISFGRNVNTSNTTVTLTRKSDGREWNFDRSLSQSQFLVDNDGYGQAGCVAFKPTGIDAYRDGDVYNVVVKEDGSIIADYDVNFFDFYPVENITLNKTEITLEKGKTAYIRATIFPSNATDQTIKWSSSEPAVASINQYTTVTALKAGTTTITATDATGKVSASCIVTVTEKEEKPAPTPTEKKLDASNISLKFQETTYTGSAIRPAVTVSGMRQGSDYRVTYSNNVNAGTAVVKIEGLGNVKGTVTKNFTIKPKSLEKKQITFSAATAKVANLVQDRDYTVTVKKETNGDTTITVKGIGNYTGEFTETYSATTSLDPQAVTLEYSETVYDGTYQKPKVTVSGLKENADYSVKYTNNLKAGTASVTITGAGRYSGKVVKTFIIKKREIKDADVTLKAIGTNGNATATVQGLKVGTDYTAAYYYLSQTGEIRVRIEGINSCTGLVRKSVFVTGYTIVPQMFFVIPTSFNYSGKECRPEISIGTLVENVDYKVSYQDNINAGKGKVTVTGLGAYSGSATKEFTIKQGRLNELPVEISYDKGTNKVTVTIPGLVEGTDYTVSVSNTSPKKLFVKVTGKGNYTNSVTQSITLDAKPIEASMFSLAYTSTTYSGEAKKPAVKSTSLKASDYTISYANNTNAGTATVSIKGKNAYTGTVTLTFTIKPKALQRSMFDVKIDEGAVTVSGNGLTEKKDFVLSTGENNAMVVKGIGNYSGTVTIDGTEIDQEIDQDAQTEGKPSTKPAMTSISKLTLSKKYGIKVTWKKKNADGYQVRYATTKSFKSYRTKTVSKGSMTSTNLKNLKKGKTYYVKVRAYKLDENGKKIYGLFSQTKKIKNK